MKFMLEQDVLINFVDVDIFILQIMLNVDMQATNAFVLT